jgi:hypothetical protein
MERHLVQSMAGTAHPALQQNLYEGMLPGQPGVGHRSSKPLPDPASHVAVCKPDTYRKNSTSPAFTHGTIYSMNLDGTGMELFASGEPLLS